jgi:glyoxylate reductase
VERLAAEHEVDVWEEERRPTREELLSRVSEAEGLLPQLTERVDEELFAAAPLLRAVANYAVGYDNVDLAAATARGIPVGNTPGVLTEATADLTWALMLSAARRLPEAEDDARTGVWGWEPDFLLGQDVHGATLGIVGMGRIGCAIARRAAGFAMPVLYNNRTRLPEAQEREVNARHVPLDELLAQSDFVVISCALTPETRHLISERELGLMKRTAVLVNIARGPIVDQRALYRALVDNKIWAAGLDVFEQEPVPMDEPLLRLDNVVLPPHLGSASVATRIKMATLAAENCLAGVRGEVPPNVVNREALERR